jgi:hypothetical protein
MPYSIHRRRKKRPVRSLGANCSCSCLAVGASSEGLGAPNHSDQAALFLASPPSQSQPAS